MDAIPDGEGCSFEGIALGLIVLVLIILLLPGLSWLIKLGLGFMVSVFLIAILASHFWNTP
jgi:hypothetical protein